MAFLIIRDFPSSSRLPTKADCAEFGIIEFDADARRYHAWIKDYEAAGRFLREFIGDRNWRESLEEELIRAQNSDPDARYLDPPDWLLGDEALLDHFTELCEDCNTPDGSSVAEFRIAAIQAEARGELRLADRFRESADSIESDRDRGEYI